jgi:hypothetical protein
MKASKILKKAKALIADPKHWTTEAFARTARGDSVSASHPKAVCFCAVGAINRAAANTDYYRQDAFSFLLNTTYELFDNSIVTNNDLNGFDAVHIAFDEAIARAESADA